MPNQLPKGTQGELQAKKLLASKGYRFITANFHCVFGEIDLIFLDHKTLVFVEVKTRWSSKYGTPEESITPRKLKSLIKTAEFFTTLHPEFPSSIRLDVVTIDLTDVVPVIRHLKNVTG